MQDVKIKSLKEAASILPMLEVIRIGLMLKEGHTVTVVDERAGKRYIFEPTEKEATT